MSEYGVSSNWIGTAGAVMAMAGAIFISFRRRAQWEPSAEDVPIPDNSQRFAGLAAAAIIAILADLSEPEKRDLLPDWVTASVVASVAFLLIYGYLIARHTYDKAVVTVGQRRTTTSIRILGGFRLTEAAKKAIAERNVTVQQLLEEGAYEPEEVWTPGSRKLSKLFFVAAYIGLVGCGAVALASAALLLGLQ